MPPWIFTTLLLAFLPVGGGIWASLVGFGLVGKVPEKLLTPRARAGRQICRIGGPLLVVAGLWIGFQPLIAPEFGLHWETYAPAGGHFSIDLPGTPLEAITEETGEYGPVENHLARLFLWRLDVTCTIRWTRLPETFPKMSPERSAKWLEELVEKNAAINQATVVSNKQAPRTDGAAQEFRFDLPNGYISRGLFVLSGRTRIEVTVVTPVHLAYSEMVKRILESLSPLPAAERPGEVRDAEDRMQSSQEVGWRGLSGARSSARPQPERHCLRLKFPGAEGRAWPRGTAGGPRAALARRAVATPDRMPVKTQILSAARNDRHE